jgi:hypothetical protein
MLVRHRLGSPTQGETVGLFKSPDEKAAAQERRVEQKYASSPVGRATAAHERGDSLFQISLPADEGSAPILSEIEAIGWHLEHVGYTSIVWGYGSPDSVNIDSRLAGIYLFRWQRVPHP